MHAVIEVVLRGGLAFERKANCLHLLGLPRSARATYADSLPSDIGHMCVHDDGVIGLAVLDGKVQGLHREASPRSTRNAARDQLHPTNVRNVRAVRNYGLHCLSDGFGSRILHASVSRLGIILGIIRSA